MLASTGITGWPGRGFKIETKTSVLGFHAGFVPAIDAQVILGAWAAPILGRKILLSNVVQLRPACPDRFGWRGDHGVNRNSFSAHINFLFVWFDAVSPQAIRRVEQTARAQWRGAPRGFC